MTTWMHPRTPCPAGFAERPWIPESPDQVRDDVRIKSGTTVPSPAILAGTPPPVIPAGAKRRAGIHWGWDCPRP
jgi:hypothetical protein